ncbi:nuclear transport factor 2 family protein [Rhodococcus rhodochrous]|uniref:nuclear transport factor 2 family protein n=1 Tax=Rhodococcus rhodochrous TaxID=1829 RepID=UPI001E4B8018|nr:nuclear transport factor 2 family protein [Rhodococcus rhodochrous]MCD2098623.1 nuclear transport factor 2 family protein [Rhodococcus rhodochrous]MCD2123107.1 nuclear transport factor 2 family protein [Rhodococcus rhodochrous]MCQ4137747.1 nuclear transport factor 2 family protein [Rhodococcus rhodochrous]MDJ0019735.1 nuclear transport factor 2 family protein [Rhodococcus rhodochrous]
MTPRPVRTLCAATAIAALTALTGCSSDDAGDDTATTTSATTTTSTTVTAAVTVEQLQEQIDVFFDPTATTEQRAAVVENGSGVLTVLDQFGGVLHGYPLTGTVGEITTVDADTVTATTEVDGPHGGAPLPLTFEQVDGTWVIADESACSVLSMGQLSCN